MAVINTGSKLYRHNIVIGVGEGLEAEDWEAYLTFYDTSETQITTLAQIIEKCGSSIPATGYTYTSSEKGTIYLITITSSVFKYFYYNSTSGELERECTYSDVRFTDSVVSP